MERILTNLLRALGRLFPDCVALSQAIAFNMFVAFFPLLLLATAMNIAPCSMKQKITAS